MVCQAVLKQGCLNKHPVGQHLMNSQKMYSRSQTAARFESPRGRCPSSRHRVSFQAGGWVSEALTAHHKQGRPLNPPACSQQHWRDCQDLSCWICWFSKKRGWCGSLQDVNGTVTCDTDTQFTLIFCMFLWCNKQLYWQYTAHLTNFALNASNVPLLSSSSFSHAMQAFYNIILKFIYIAVINDNDSWMKTGRING